MCSDSRAENTSAALPQSEMRALFTRIADGYDRLNRILSLGTDILWRRRALAGLPSVPKNILDLACGTADFALAAARRFPSARVTGVDLTPAMITLGTDKIRRAGLSDRLVLKEGDALALPFSADTFDTALCAFGFRNFPNAEAALAEAFRVLKPDGVLAVLEFFRPKSPVFGWLTAHWLQRAAPLFAPGNRTDYAYLQTSITRTLTVDAFTAAAVSVGFTVIKTSFFLPACSCVVLRKASSR